MVLVFRKMGSAKKRLQLTEEEREEKLQSMSRTLKSFRGGGWFFLIFGCIMLLSFIPTLLDPEGMINVNGEPRNEWWIKAGILIFISLFPAIGSFLALSPKKRFENIFLSFQLFAEDYYKASTRK